MTKNNNISITTPSTIEVEKYLKKWKSNDRYIEQEGALNKLFKKLVPSNTDILDILLKCSTLNDFYSTNIFKVYTVAKHIHDLDIDKRLLASDEEIVNEIAKVKEINKNFYSFATKYCSHHRPDDYPIYDSYILKVLIHFSKKDNFAKFKSEDLRNYPKFKEVLIAFRNFYGLNDYTLKEIDMYLWQIGKESFKRY